MARTIEQIKSAIITDLRNRSSLDALDSTSAVAIYNLIIYIVAAGMAAFENLNDLFRSEIQDLVSTLKPHSVSYYRQKALDFQLGYDLPDGEVVYDNTGIDDDVVSDSKIVEFASVSEEGTTLLIKVAKENISPLSSSELEAFSAYIEDVKDAGVRLEIISTDPDRMRAVIDVYYDPTILNGQGQRLDGTFDNSVYAAALDYTERLQVNGRFVRAYFIDRLQQVEGVNIPHVRSLEIARNGDPNYISVDVNYTPFSGFVRIYDQAELTLNYIADA